MYYEGPLRISKTEGLSADEAAVEAGLTECAKWLIMFFTMSSPASKVIIPKSTKHLSKKVRADKIESRSTDAAEEARADRAVAIMIAGFNEARRTGKFPKVY